MRVRYRVFGAKKSTIDAMNPIRKLFHCSENKFFAVLFSALALAVTLGWLIYSIIVLGGAFFTFRNVWNYFIQFLIFGTLFFYNIFNDNRAYTAISLLLFVALIGSFISLIYDFVDLIQARFSPQSLLVLPVMAFDIACIALAAVAFIHLNSYRIGRSDDYKKVRLFLILFAVSVVLPSLAMFIVYASASQLETAWFVLVTALCSDFATLCAAVAAVFTFNRLIR